MCGWEEFPCTLGFVIHLGSAGSFSVNITLPNQAAEAIQQNLDV